MCSCRRARDRRRCRRPRPAVEWAAAAAKALASYPPTARRRLAVASLVAAPGGRRIRQPPVAPPHVAAGRDGRSGLPDRRPGFAGRAYCPAGRTRSGAALKKALEGFDIVDVRDAASREALDGLALRGGGRVTASATTSGWPCHSAGGATASSTSSAGGAVQIRCPPAAPSCACSPTRSRTSPSTARPGCPPSPITPTRRCAIGGPTGAGDRHRGDPRARPHRRQGARRPARRCACIVPFLSVWRDGLPIGAGQTWLTTRFHPHLIAVAAGDSGAAVVTKPDYYGTKHASLVDCGSRWTVADGTSVPTGPLPGFSPPTVRATSTPNVHWRECYPRDHRDDDETVDRRRALHHPLTRDVTDHDRPVDL